MAILRKKITAKEAIAQLMEGNYDTPIRYYNKHDKPICVELEKLRVKLRDDRLAQKSGAVSLNATVSSIAHDLKTPLAIIAGYAECLDAGMTDKDYCNLIIEKANQMNDKVVEIVEANRKEDRNTEDFVKVNTKVFFYDECERCRGLAKEKDITFTVKSPPFDEIFCLKRSISTMLQNLISNAVKYTQKGGKVRVDFAITPNYFKINVRDNGIGISKQDLPYIFEKYFIADKTRNDIKNSGLGLANVKYVLEQHGGFVKVKSKPQKGSTFSVYLPREKKERKYFEDYNRVIKIAIMTAGLPFLSPVVYRLSKAIRNNDTKNILTSLVGIPFFICMWIFDVIDLAVGNKISLFVSPEQPVSFK